VRGQTAPRRHRKRVELGVGVAHDLPVAVAAPSPPTSGRRLALCHPFSLTVARF
jgi:hypothetical protein